MRAALTWKARRMHGIREQWLGEPGHCGIGNVSDGHFPYAATRSRLSFDNGFSGLTFLPAARPPGRL